jgi:hypothetical protein
MILDDQICLSSPDCKRKYFVELIDTAIGKIIINVDKINEIYPKPIINCSVINNVLTEEIIGYLLYIKTNDKIMAEKYDSKENCDKRYAELKDILC